MTSKNHWQHFKDKPDLASNKSIDVYNNFNLSKNHKCTPAFDHGSSYNAEIGKTKSSDYEFPRQKEDQASAPEVQQFSASQRLFTPVQQPFRHPVVQQPAVNQTPGMSDPTIDALISPPISTAVEAKASSSSFFDRTYASLSSNPLFSAGAGLAGLGILAQFGRRLLIVGNSIARRKFISKLQITNEEPSYQYVLDFINLRSSHKTPNLTVNSALRQYEGGKVIASHILLPGHGIHYFSYNYRWIQVERQREDHQIQRDGIRKPLETVTLTKLGVDPKFWVDFLRAATEEALAKLETGLVINKPIGTEWRRSGGVQPKRPLESVVLADGVAKSICDDVQDFLKTRKWYTDRGIPYRRGYLFYGPPGTGKTSFITALAAHFGYSICILSLSDRLLDDDRLCYLMNCAPANSFIVLEDVDAAFISKDRFDNNEHPAYQGLTRVTLSGLLNSIDGVASSEERILFMTTNHIEHLDAALIRPGRVDVKKYFGNSTPDMVKRMFQRFYEDVSEELINKFVEATSKLEKSISPAELQKHFILYKNSPEAAIEHINDLL